MKNTLYALSFVLFAAGGFAAEEAVREVEIPLIVKSAQGATAYQGRVSMYSRWVFQPKNVPHVCLEAENYDEIAWQPIVQTSSASEQYMEEFEKLSRLKSFEDADASNSQYVKNATKITYAFRLAQSAKYTIWFRVKPNPDRQSVFRAQLFLQERVGVVVPKGDDWVWVKTPAFNVPARNYFLYVSNLSDDVALDKIVLSTDAAFAPEGRGPEMTPLSVAAKGLVVFEPLRRPEVLEWRRINHVRLNAAGRVRFEYSLDNEKTWQAVGADGALGPLANSPETGLTIRAVMELDADKKSAEIQFPTITFSVPSDFYRKLESKTAEYVFNSKTGAVSGISAKTFGGAVEIKPVGSESEPFRIFVVPEKTPPDPGKWYGIGDFENAGATFTDKSAEFTFKGRQYPATVRLIYTVNPDGYLNADIEVANGGDADVLEAEFPIMENLKIGASGYEDVLFWPEGTGKKFVNPPTMPRQLSKSYPTGVVPFAALYDKSAGLYLATHDPNLISTLMSCEADKTKTWVWIKFLKRDRIRPGKQTRFPLVIGAHPGEWHTAGDWYRNWYYKTFEAAAWPEWVAESDGWLFDNLSFARPHYETLNEFVFYRALRLGFKHVQIWGTTTAGSCPLYYYLPHDIGGPEGFAKGNKWWKDRGGVVGYYVCPNYTNAYFFHENTKLFFTTPWSEIQEWGLPPGYKEGRAWQWYEENAYYDRERKPKVPALERWAQHFAKLKGTDKWMIPPHVQGMMTVHSQPFLDWFKSIVIDKYVGEFNCGAMYFDTMHYGAERPEFNPYLKKHGEGNGGLIRHRYAKMLKQEGLKYNPDWLPIMEMQTDAYSMYFAMMIGSSAHDKDPEMLHYVHPTHLAFEGQTGAGWGVKRFSRFNSAWLYGSRLDHREYEAWAVETIRMRNWITRWINASRFLDDLGLFVDSNEVRGKLHRVLEADGTRGFLATFWNTARREAHPGNKTLVGRQWPPTPVEINLAPLTRVDNTGTKPADWIPKRAILIDMNNLPREIEFEVADRDTAEPKLRFKLPPRQINGVLFVCEASGPYSFLARARQRRFAATEVQIMNPGTKEIAGRVSVRAETVQYETDAKPFSAKPGELVTVSFPYKSGQPPAVTELVLVDIEANGAKRQLRSAAYPFMDDPDFEVSVIGTYTSDTAASGKRARVLPAGTTPTFRVSLEPSMKYRLSMKVRGVNADGKLAFWYDRPSGAKELLDGVQLNFSVSFDFTDKEWRPVSFTFETPEMYHDGKFWCKIGKDAVLLDDVKIEVLPDDASVEYRPK